jgi:hypothetical protein
MLLKEHNLLFQTWQKSWWGKIIVKTFCRKTFYTETYETSSLTPHQLGKILTAENLRKRNIVIVSWCCMCKADGETIDHLFIHCPVAKELWDGVLHHFEVSWVLPSQVKELIEGWFGGLPKHRLSRIWNIVPHCLMWSLWREQNLRTFEDSETSLTDLKMQFFRMLFEWTQAMNCFSFSSFHDFLISFNS